MKLNNSFILDHPVVYTDLQRVLTIRSLTQGMTQHPHSVKKVKATMTPIMSDNSKAFPFPKMLSNHLKIDISVPAFSLSSSANFSNLLSATVKEPSAAVLLGIKVQHARTSHTRRPFQLTTCRAQFCSAMS